MSVNKDEQLPNRDSGVRHKNGHLIDISQVKPDELRSTICIRAREKYPDKLVMLQPVPNKSSIEEYQLCVKPKETKHCADFEWEVLVEGTLDAVWAQL